ncbi:MAG: putative sensor domain DACNV-containing protein [Pyrinomonadaceae bacterium]
MKEIIIGRREPSYQAARDVSAMVESHFAKHIGAAYESGEHEVAPQPDAPAIEAIIDATFWASLRREEGNFPKITVAFVPPEKVGQPLIFESLLPLTPTVLTKLGPAVERPGIHLGVWHYDGELRLWGATRTLPSFCFVLEVIEPGLLVVKHRRMDGYGKFANVAVLKGQHVKVIDEQGASLPECPALLASLLAFTSPGSWDHSINVLVQLAASMRAHGHGGSLLVVPTQSESWRQSIVHPVLYSVEPPFTALAELLKLSESERNENLFTGAVRRAVDTVAGLTAVDGATVINDEYEVLAFGAKIRRPEGSPPVEQIVGTEPIVGDRPIVVHPVQNGGTRHLSAAQFVHDQRDSMALVASQDGRFTIFAWSPCEEMVHAHRVDTLLL